MSTGLVRGLSLQAAALVVSEKAAELRTGSGVGLWTEVGANVVLVGLATESGSCAIAVDRAEYDGLKLLEMIDLGSVHDQGAARLAAAG